MKIILFLVIFGLNLSVFGDNSGHFDEFCEILAVIESSNNPKAHNLKENAIGLYQIRPICFKDAQIFNKNLRKYKHSDCFRPEIAKLVVKSYLAKYCKTDDFEEWAKIWNGGPNGPKKKATEKYWEKFKKIVDRRAGNKIE